MESNEIAVTPVHIVLFLGVVGGSIWAWARPMPALFAGGERPAWLPWRLTLYQFLLLLWFVVLVLLFVPFLTEGLVRPFYSSPEEGEKIRTIAATLGTQIMLAGIVLLALRFANASVSDFFLRSGASSRRIAPYGLQTFLRYLPLVWAVGLYWSGLILLLRKLGHTVEIEPQIAVTWIVESTSPVFLITMGLMVIVLAPVVEELIFRGFLYRLISERISPRTALVVTSILFSLMHASLHGFLPLFFLGMLLAKSYEDTRDIRVPMLFHSAFNAYSYLILITLPPTT